MIGITRAESAILRISTFGVLDVLNLTLLLAFEAYELVTGQSMYDSGQLHAEEVAWRMSGGLPLSEKKRREKIMKIRFASISYAILILVLTSLACANFTGGDTTQEPLATPSGLIQVMAKPSLTKTPEPTATIDPGLQATGTKLALQAQEIGQAQTLQAFDMTRGASTATAAVATATSEAGRAKASETAMVYRTEIAPQAYKRMKTAETEALTEKLTTWIVFMLVTGVIVISVIWIISAIRAREMEAQAMIENARAIREQARKPEPAKLVIENRTGTDFLQVNWQSLPIDIETFETVLEMLQAGKSYTLENFTGSARPLSRSTSFPAFGDWLVQNGLAIRMGDKRYALNEKAIKTLEMRPPLPHGFTSQ